MNRALGVADDPINAVYEAAIVKSSNEWAACARGHGWPGVADIAMTAGSGGEDWAKVLLPSTMSDLQLEQLLAVCPSFDAEQEDENIEAMRSWDASSNELPSGYRAQPSIGFVDPNSGTSASSAPTGVASVLPIGKTEATSEETARLERLKTILNKEHDDYYSGLMGG